MASCQVLLLLLVVGGHHSEREFGDIPVVNGVGENVTLRVEEEVVVLNEDNFHLIVLSKPLILVQFFAHWCVHCQALAPEFEKAAKELRKDGIPLAKVDATKEEAIAREYGVRSFPTLFVFANGVHSEYDGSRTSAAIVEFMRRKADPDFRPPPEAVVSLTSDAFDAFVAKHPLFLVAFVTPSCGHCQRLAPEYERAAQQLAEVWPPIPLTKVDVSLERALAERFSVSAFPTLFVFRKGKHVTYRGGRDETAIVRFMRAQQNTPSKVVSSLAELRKALTPDWPTVVAFLGDSSPFLDVWEEAAFAGKERNYKFLHVTDADVTSAAGESADSIVVFSGQWFESKTHRMPFTASVTADDISRFVWQHSRPLVGLRTPSTEWLFERRFPLAVVYYDVDFSPEHRSQTQLTRAQVVAVAQQFPNVTFCVAREEDYAQELRDLHLEDSSEDVNCALFLSRSRRFALPPEDGFSSAVFARFVSAVLEGRARPTLRSQSVRKSVRHETGVTSVVGLTFDQLVVESPKHVLLMFYAHWCAHCQAVAPVFRQVAEHYSGRADIEVAAIEGTQNDFRDDIFAEVNAFPAFYLLRANHKQKALKFESHAKPTLESLTRFVDETIVGARDEL